MRYRNCIGNHDKANLQIWSCIIGLGSCPTNWNPENACGSWVVNIKWYSLQWAMGMAESRKCTHNIFILLNHIYIYMYIIVVYQQHPTKVACLDTWYIHLIFWLLNASLWQVQVIYICSLCRSSEPSFYISCFKPYNFTCVLSPP